ncbi:MAG: GNAT family N-acetyltransferase [Candidatus Thorarchaeota archaeon]
MLQNDRVLLRGLELTDLDELMKHWNKREVKKYLNKTSPHSREEELEWIRQTWERRRKGEAYIFAIILQSKDLYIGNVELSIQNQVSRRGLIGIVIFNPSFWNQGIGSETLREILKFGFQDLNLHSIELEVFSINQRALACYRKVGFRESGRRRQAVFFEGEYVDSIVMDIVATEWPPNQVGT